MATGRPRARAPPRPRPAPGPAPLPTPRPSPNPAPSPSPRALAPLPGSAPAPPLRPTPRARPQAPPPPRPSQSLSLRSRAGRQRRGSSWGRGGLPERRVRGPGAGCRRLNRCVLQLRRLRGAGNRKDGEPGDAGSSECGSDHGTSEPPVRSIQHLRGRRRSSLRAPWKRNTQVCLHRTPAKIYTHKQHPCSVD